MYSRSKFGLLQYYRITTKRLQRKMLKRKSFCFIFTQEQYIFVHTSLFEALTCGNTEIPAHNLKSKMKKLSTVTTNNDNMSGYEMEFKVHFGCEGFFTY